MKREFACSLLALGAWVAACQKSPEPPRGADRAMNGLMPGGMPGTERLYVEDQAQVRLSAARKVSYDALDDFRAKNREKSGQDAGKTEAGADGGDDSAGGMKDEAAGGESDDTDADSATPSPKKPAPAAKPGEQRPTAKQASAKKDAKVGKPDTKPVDGMDVAKRGKQKAEAKQDADDKDEDWTEEEGEKEDAAQKESKPAAKKPSGG